MALVYALPYKTTRLLGRDKGPAVNKMTDRTVKEDIRLTLASIKKNLRIGNILMGDDGAGVKVLELLPDKINKIEYVINNEGWQTLIGLK